MNSLHKLAPNTSSDEISLDSATTSADKTEKITLSSSQNRQTSKRRSAIPALRRPILCSSPPSASCHIRHRYLVKLGVLGGSPVSSFKPPLSSNSSQMPNTSPTGILRTGNSKPPQSPPTKPSVSFKTKVSIQYIPDKRQLVNREDLWVQKEEFSQSLQRNCLEYAADGWSWENATEECDFICYQNELVHPAHFKTCSMQRQFLMTMYAQRQLESS